MSYESYANILIPNGVTHLNEIVTAAGGVSGTGASDGVRLYIPNVTQVALDRAVLQHDEKALLLLDTWISVRGTRNKLLLACDYTQLSDYVKPDKQAYIIYRDTLRNLPQTQTDPFNIIWPVKP